MLISKYRQELDEAVLNLPGLVFFGHNISTRAALPMNMHTHDDCLEIVAVIKGNESYYIKNRKYELSGGDVFVSLPGQPHKSGSTAQGVCEIFWFHINPNITRDFLGLSTVNGDLLKAKLLAVDTHMLRTDKEGMTFLKKSFDNFCKQKKENRLYAQSLLISFIYKLLFVQDKERRDNELIDNILQYIDNNIYDVIKFEDICSEFNISQSSFKHKFKEYTGVTPRDYINGRKIQIAKKLLMAGMNVTEAAMRLSFNSCDYFSVVFKKYMACSPSLFIESQKTSDQI